jgi:hypothetical protein
MEAVGDVPVHPGARHMPRVSGLRVFHIRFARRLLALEHRVSEPRHLLVYRVGDDGITEILALIHDRMLLSRAAHRIARETDAYRRPAPANLQPSGLQCRHRLRQLLGQQVDLQHAPAPAAHHVGADHILQRMVRTLDQHVGPQSLDQCLG